MCFMKNNMETKSNKLLHALQRSYDRRKIKRNREIWQPGKVRDMLYNHFDQVNLQWEDGQYVVCDIGVIKYILEHSIVDDLKYTSEVFDCDNFASLFKSLTAIRYHLNSIGRVINYDGAHAFNIALTKGTRGAEGDVYVIEPQNDMDYWRYDRQKVEKRYKIDKQIVII